ncbi:hypothetical protein [Bacillus atrophaeus]|uniref:hypothetical protein n=1 Tax=Bacillus atrophaeus TaxID=1452 RepID=UPI00255C15A6|nr:hypothetical protein [Bacillus atrophaeus]MDL5141145.1 hypothetical protein [Bacillus atrophaeus]
MQINRHTVGNNVNIHMESEELTLNNIRIGEMSKYFHHFIQHGLNTDANFLETHNNGAPTKRFNVHTEIRIPAVIQIDAEDEKDAIEKLEEMGEMGVNHAHVMLEMCGGKTVIPRVTDSLFYIDEETVAEEVEDYE